MGIGMPSETKREPYFIKPTTRLFSEDERNKIHSSVLEVMSEVGMLVYDKEALEIYKQAGCKVEKKHVYFNASLVEWAIKQAPSRVLLYDREGNLALDLSGRNVYYGVGSACPRFNDPFTGEQRMCVEQDNFNAVKVADTLDCMDFMMSMCQIYDHPKTSYEHEFAAMVRFSSKPQVVITADLQSTKNVVKMASIVRGGMENLRQKPLFVNYCEPTSPFVGPKESVQKLMYLAKEGIPCMFASGLMIGGTSPVTPAGSIIEIVAESLAGLVLAQLINPGTPYVFGGCAVKMDLKSMQPIFAEPSAMLTTLGMAEIGRELYHLPTWGFSGGTASKVADEQAVMDGTRYAMMDALTGGANLCHDTGYSTFGLAYDLDLAMMLNENVRAIRHLMRGINTTDDAMGVDMIKRVGPKGNYLGEEHTLKYHKMGHLPDLEDAKDFDEWVADGSTTMRQRANRRVRDIIENGEWNSLPDEIDQQIVEFLDRIDREEAMEYHL